MVQKGHFHREKQLVSRSWQPTICGIGRRLFWTSSSLVPNRMLINSEVPEVCSCSVLVSHSTWICLPIQDHSTVHIKAIHQDNWKLSFRGAFLIWTTILMIRRMALIAFFGMIQAATKINTKTWLTSGMEICTHTMWRGQKKVIWTREGGVVENACFLTNGDTSPATNDFESHVISQHNRRQVLKTEFLASLCTRKHWMAGEHSTNDTWTMTQPLFQQKGSGICIKK